MDIFKYLIYNLGLYYKSIFSAINDQNSLKFLNSHSLDLFSIILFDLIFNYSFNDSNNIFLYLFKQQFK